MATTVAHDNSHAVFRLFSRRRLRALSRAVRTWGRPAIIWLVVLSLLPVSGCKTNKVPEACLDPWVKHVPEQALQLPNPLSCEPVDGRAIETARPHSLRNTDAVE